MEVIASHCGEEESYVGADAWLRHFIGADSEDYCKEDNMLPVDSHVLY